ncbi:hypothetical protein [Novipirellula caenicola]|uniref:Uncharacterized protein n=1 Tax=Novipirellula caenicola TaxID=1536901 RepID=A0ABP9VIX6_9BACT
MTGWLYTLRERFTPDLTDRWDRYRHFSGFHDIAELVTLDSMMCPDVITELRDDDWQYNVHEDFRTELFRDGDYLLNRQPLDPLLHQLIAAHEHPDGSESIPAGFTFCGYDIMDSYFGNSTLTNCGPIPEAFTAEDVNRYGLVQDLAAALRIRDAMRKQEPDDPHLGQCEVWLVAQRIPNGG